MPSQLHEALLELFRNEPTLAPELLRGALQMELPAFSEVRIDSAELNQIQPTEYRADLVVLLLHGEPVLGIVVEVQLAPDERKHYSWPVYVSTLRARLECPVCLLVVAADEATASWGRKVVELGGGNRFQPLVLGPSGVPVVTDLEEARAHPELAVLSVLSHGQGPDAELAARIAAAAQIVSHELDPDRAKLYFDLTLNALSEAARRALQNMDMSKYEYQSDFARRYVAQGRMEGRAELLARLLSHRFGPLPDDVRDRLATASIDELDAIGERLLAARNLPEALQSE